MEFFKKHPFVIITPSLLLGLLLIASLGSLNKGLSGATRVVDGDTLEVGGRKYRLSGIDAPEAKQTCNFKGEVWPCGRKATEALREKIGEEEVRCVGNERDRYGRILGTCFKGNQNLNEWLVLNGWAVAYIRYSREYYSAQERPKNRLRNLER